MVLSVRHVARMSTGKRAAEGGRRSPLIHLEESGPCELIEASEVARLKLGRARCQAADHMYVVGTSTA